LTFARSTGRSPVRRAAALAGVALMGAALLIGAPQVVTAFNASSAASTLFQLMNGARVNNGRNAVQPNGTLTSLAVWRSKDQVQRDYFDHTIKGTSYQVYHWYDTNGLRYVWGGENIGWNNGYSDTDSPVAIHEGFMNSPEHRANILEPSFTHGGVGAYGADNVMFLGKQRSPRFYTELFMQAAGSAPPPPSSGGGDGGGSAPPPSSGPAASSDGHHKSARNLRVDTPSAPRSSDPLDGAKVVAARPSLSVPAGAQEALVDRPSGPAVAAAPVRAGSMRIQAADSPERGLFETVLGSLLGFVL